MKWQSATKKWDWVNPKPTNNYTLLQVSAIFTSWIRFLLTVLVKKFFISYGARKFIIVSTRIHQCNISWSTTTLYIFLVNSLISSRFFIWTFRISDKTLQGSPLCILHAGQSDPQFCLWLNLVYLMLGIKWLGFLPLSLSNVLKVQKPDKAKKNMPPLYLFPTH